MNRDTVIAMAREAGLIRTGDGWTEPHRWGMDEIERFAALVEEHLKAEGHRHCAKGQRTTQWCGMLEQAVRIEREECARVVENYCGAWNDEGYALAAAIRSRT